MPCYSELYQQFDEVKQHLPRLSLPQLHGAVLWSIAIITGGICSLSAAEIALQGFEQQSLNTLRQRLREFYKDSKHKKGNKRCELKVFDHFPDLLRWVVNSSDDKNIAIALDASNFRDRFVLLCISVVIRGCAIPVAWRILPANKPGAWKPHWCSLLESLKDVIEPDRFVIVMADRGLYGKWLFKTITQLGWHPFLRVNENGTFEPTKGTPSASFRNFLPKKGEIYRYYGRAFRGVNSLQCTLLVFFDDKHKPFYILTDVTSDVQADPIWYAMRFWIERQFKTLKTAGMQLQRTRLKEADRLERMLLPATIALIHQISAGLEYEQNNKLDCNIAKKQRIRPSGTVGRRHSLARMGAGILRTLLFQNKLLPPIKFINEKWPDYRTYFNSV